MQAFFDALLLQITQTNLWGALLPAAGLISVAVIFALAIHFTRKAVKGVSKAKVRF